MAGGHEATWAPVWAPRVRSREEIRRQLIGQATSLFKRVFPLLLIRVGLCPTRFFYFAGDVDKRPRSRGPESTRSSNQTRGYYLP